MPRSLHFPAARAVLAATLAAVLPLGGFLGASAQEEGPGDGSQSLPVTTTSTTAPSGSTTTTTVARAPEGFSGPTTTTAPPAPAPAGGAPLDGGGDGVDPAASTRVVPPEAQAIINSIKRSPANNTRKLLDALRPLVDYGLTEQEAAVVGMGRFPVAGYATFVDDWYFPRFVPSFHFHEGTDIFAAAGTPVRAPIEGSVRISNGPIGGLAVYVTQDDGTYVYMGHLAGLPEGLADGQRVNVGQVVGFVGDSGNARGGAPHVHFEIHPAPVREIVVGKGKNRRTELQKVPVAPGTRLPPTNPKPFLDRWIAEAIARAPELIASYEATRPRPVLATALTRRLATGQPSVFAGPAEPPRSQLLWATSANPAGGALALAEAEAARLAVRLTAEAGG